MNKLDVIPPALTSILPLLFPDLQPVRRLIVLVPTLKLISPL